MNIFRLSVCGTVTVLGSSLAGPKLGSNLLVLQAATSLSQVGEQVTEGARERLRERDQAVGNMGPMGRRGAGGAAMLQFYQQQPPPRHSRAGAGGLAGGGQGRGHVERGRQTQVTGCAEKWNRGTDQR